MGFSDIANMRIKIGADAAGVKRASAVAVAAIASIGAAAIAAAAKAAHAAGVQERAFATLANRIGTEAAREFAEFASELQKVTEVGDEAAMTAATIGSSFGLTGKKLQDATRIAADMAATYGMDLNAAMRVVGQGLTGQISMLGRFVPSLKGAKFETLGYQGVLDELTKSFGGAAVAAADTYLGSINQLKNSFGDLTEKVGAPLAALFKEVNKAIKEQIDGVNENSALWDEWGEVVRTTAVVIVDAIAALVSFGGRAIQVGQILQRVGRVWRLAWEVAAKGVSFIVLKAYALIVRHAANTARDVTDALNRIPGVNIPPPTGLEEFAKIIEDEAAAQLDDLNKKTKELTQTATGFGDAWVKTGKAVDGMLGFLADLRARLQGVRKDADAARGEGSPNGGGTGIMGLASAMTAAAAAGSEMGTNGAEDIAKLTDAQQNAINAAMRLGSAFTQVGRDAEAAWRDIALTILSVIKDVVTKSIMARAAEAAAGAASSQAAIPVIGPALAVAAAGAIFAMVSGYLTKFHSGGVVGSGAGVHLPGMASDERAITVQTGEVVLPRGAGGGMNITFQSFLPVTEAEARRATERHVIPRLRKLQANGFA